MYQQKINSKTKATICRKIAEDPSYRENINRKIVGTRMLHKAEDPDFQKKINEKIKKTCLERYGVEKPSLTPNAVKSARINSGRRSYERYILGSEYDEPLFSFEEYLNRKDSRQKLKFKCRKCRREFEAHHDNGFHGRCPVCFPLKSVSHQEKELVCFVKSLCPDLIENDRTLIKPYELDVVIPGKKLALEFDGIHWHSSENRPRDYHLMKTELCEKRGYQLLHVFENEWNSKREIVESRIKNLLGIYDRTVFARKCEVRNVPNPESLKFLDENHIQGGVNSGVNFGLYAKDELVSIMTFSKPRFDKRHEWELVRFCSKIGWHVPGAAGKLLKAFERAYAPKSLVSYADRRWSTGKLYTALGFRLDHTSKPDYWYFKDRYVLESRVKYQKHKLSGLLEIYDENKTEIENMKANGYERIFDCGNYVFEKIYVVS